MRRLARHLFSLCSVVSLVLCMAVCVVWVRSYSVHDAYSLPGEGEGNARLTALSIRGQLRLITSKAWGTAWLISESGRGGGYYRGDPRLSPVKPTWSFLGFGYDRQGSRWVQSRMAVIPYWSLAAACSLLPLLRLVIALQRRKRMRPGLCPVCGYDLRASPERCPECGAEHVG